MLQAVHGWSSTYERFVKSQKFFSSYLTQEDLSRLGRDQIGTVYYYQCFFPAHGVRYVAVSEGFDTAAGHTSIALPFLAAANDFYTADISRKVRAALDARRRSGSFIGASPPLGYRKDPEQRGKLLVDGERRWIVEEVFRRYLESGSVRGTARALSAAQVPTPAQCRGEGSRGVWSDTMVRRILTNPTYAGHLTQNRSEKASYKITRRIAHPPEAWTVVPHTHEAIIPQVQFDRVQELLRRRSYRPPAGEAHLLTGLAFCAACGSPMSYVREGARSYMVCQGYRRGSERSGRSTRENWRRALYPGRERKRSAAAGSWSGPSRPAAAGQAISTGIRRRG